MLERKKKVRFGIWLDRRCRAVHNNENYEAQKKYGLALLAANETSNKNFAKLQSLHCNNNYLVECWVAQMCVCVCVFARVGCMHVCILYCE